ncbi:MAG: helicase C-terminal domain-containing protein [Acholeplasmataceae bacterium]|nr:Dna2/Cas4 domain-containing protein [Acholeplasmataceae bacterium]
MSSIRIAVREMAEYLYQSGDLSADNFQNVSLLEGTRAHQYVQHQYLKSDQAEVPVLFSMPYQQHEIIISGRIDGILNRDNESVIHEIKSTRKSIFNDEFTPQQEHIAQLKFYLYMMAKNENLDMIWGRLTYVQLSDYQMRHFDEIYTVDALEAFFNESIEIYLKWLIKLYHHHEIKMQSLSDMVFPFDSYRRGQKEMMAAVYRTMKDKDILYTIAPTGIGKTMAALFSSLKAIELPEQKIFYLTAKTEGKKIALESLDMLHEGTLKTKTLELTSKDSICFLEKRECDPNICPYAKGFFDRLKDASEDIFEHETLMTRSIIEQYAKKHMVCPFEYSLYVSYFADVIICDYNYVFDPRAHLIRYFETNDYHPMLLIDEAHNMISRSRDMFSASLKKSDLIALRKAGSKLKPTIRNAVNRAIQSFDLYQFKLSELPFITFDVPNEELLNNLSTLLKKIDRPLKDNPSYSRKSEVFDGYFLILAMLKMSERFGPNYKFNIEVEDDDIKISLRCLDASKFIKETIDQSCYGAVFFSATLQPLNYYKTLITQGVGETMVIKSPFNPNHLKLLIDPTISTRYQDRMDSIDQIVQRIYDVIEAKKGNYIVFFPSYQYLDMVKDRMIDIDADLIIQTRDMSFFLRDQIMERFSTSHNRTLLAMFVMGGMFSEGIDYLGNMLHGVIIIGVGLPMINEENEQLKNYYQETFNQGFQYAYQYPGMNKVIQAVGRVIRSHDDYGFALLIDDRFNQSYYKNLFPIEWKTYERLTHKKSLKGILKTFFSFFGK